MQTNAVTNLGDALRQLQPTLHPVDYVFCTIPAQDFDQANLDRGLGGLFATVAEPEGITAILPAMAAEQAGLDCDTTRFSRISLALHSSLLAVGLTAIVSNELAEAGIACNIISGAHHDHLFVPSVHGEQALTVLKALSG